MAASQRMPGDAGYRLSQSRRRWVRDREKHMGRGYHRRKRRAGLDYCDIKSSDRANEAIGRFPGGGRVIVS